MNERLDNKIVKTEKEPGYPESFERVKVLFKKIVESQQAQILEFRAGSLRLVKLLKDIGDLPPGDIERLRIAVDECMADPAVSEETKKMLRIDYDFLWPSKE